MPQKIRIGTRGSDLALWQANHVSKLLESLGAIPEICIITTKGDRITDLSFDKIEGKGFFTKEIEDQLLNGSVDLAVHSYKDLETTQPEGLTVGATLERGYTEDVLISLPGKVDTARPYGLAENSVVGTSSVRRKAQLKAADETVNLKDLRGNVPTRVNKLREGQYDAIVLARAGVERLSLDLSDFHVLVLDPDEFVPAPAQGALALQIRSDDQELANIVERLNNDNVASCVGFERSLLNKMDGGCHVPLGALCTQEEDVFFMSVFYADDVDAPAGFYDISGNADTMSEGISDLVESLKS